MNKICVVTATRAEFGLLFRVMKWIEEDPGLALCLVVTGTHLSAAYGNTIEEIEESGLSIAEKIEILEEDRTRAGKYGDSEGIGSTSEGGDRCSEGSDSESVKICQSMARAYRLFGAMYARQKPDMLVVLGDRYELLPICSSALQFQIPIAHISGGEVTTGALDDIYRHCITKMSHLHFPGCAAYRRRIIQLGENPQRVFDYGDVGIENIMSMDFLTKEALEKALAFPLGDSYACVTFHPPTMEGANAIPQIQDLLEALEAFEDMKFIITKANADAGGREINAMIDAYTARHENWKCFYSLGIQRYLSALKYCDMVIGNSSSGIVEAPCFHIPTVNIGSRQNGRLQAESIINCAPKKTAIISAIQQAKSQEFRQTAACATNPYGNGDTSRRIVEEIKNYLKAPDFQKAFYDVAWQEPPCGTV